MNDLPRLELTADPNKNNEYIIYRHGVNDTKVKQDKMVTQNRRKYSTRKYSTTKKKKGTTKKKKSSKSRKSFFNLF